MPTLKKLLAAVALMLACLGPKAAAEMATGDYAIAFNGDVNIWDISGTYSENSSLMTLTYTLSLDPSGRITGRGPVHYQEGTDYLDGNVSIGGYVYSAGKTVRARVLLRTAGTGTVRGFRANFSGTERENLVLDPNTREMVGKYAGSVLVALPQLRRTQIVPIPLTDVQSRLPDNVDGRWDLAFNITTNRARYTGAGTLHLSNGRTIPLAVSGLYTPKTDRSLLTFRGLGVNRAIAFNLVASFSNGQMTLQSLSGKAFGQTLRWPVAP
ncbi:MAG TPA: hypothetical protein VNZ22_01875 [Bacillota bacterium]|nr:hypothetical protein [Bacillota bacterium]